MAAIICCRPHRSNIVPVAMYFTTWKTIHLVPITSGARIINLVGGVHARKEAFRFDGTGVGTVTGGLVSGLPTNVCVGSGLAIVIELAVFGLEFNLITKRHATGKNKRQ